MWKKLAIGVVILAALGIGGAYMAVQMFWRICRE